MGCSSLNTYEVDFVLPSRLVCSRRATAYRSAKNTADIVGRFYRSARFAVPLFATTQRLCLSRSVR